MPLRAIFAELSHKPTGHLGEVSEREAAAMQSVRQTSWCREQSTLARGVVGAGQHRHAFSMIELVIVLLITSIFAAVTAPAFMNSLLFHRVETAARRVKQISSMPGSELGSRAPRSRSRLPARPTRSAARRKALTTPAWPSRKPAEVAVCTRYARRPTSEAQQSFSFDGYGTPSSGGTVVLHAKDRIVHRHRRRRHRHRDDYQQPREAAVLRVQRRLTRQHMHQHNRKSRCRGGHSLMELVAAMVASAFLLAGLGSVMFIARQVAYTPTEATSRTKAADVVGADLRRAPLRDACAAADAADSGVRGHGSRWRWNGGEDSL